jgi:adenylylsulfate kinase-like enzyme
MPASKIFTHWLTGFRGAKKSILALAFVEFYVSTPLLISEYKYIKGLYKKARSTEISDFTGISFAYETPKNAYIYIHTQRHRSVKWVIDLVNQRHF